MTAHNKGENEVNLEKKIEAMEVEWKEEICLTEDDRNQPEEKDLLMTTFDPALKPGNEEIIPQEDSSIPARTVSNQEPENESQVMILEIEPDDIKFQVISVDKGTEHQIIMSLASPWTTPSKEYVETSSSILVQTKPKTQVTRKESKGNICLTCCMEFDMLGDLRAHKVWDHQMPYMDPIDFTPLLKLMQTSDRRTTILEEVDQLSAVMGDAGKVAKVILARLSQEIMVLEESIEACDTQECLWRDRPFVRIVESNCTE